VDDSPLGHKRTLSHVRTLLWLVGARQHAVDRGRSGLAKYSRKLALYLAARSLLAKREPSNPDGDYHRRADRKHRIIGERRPLPRIL